MAERVSGTVLCQLVMVMYYAVMCGTLCECAGNRDHDPSWSVWTRGGATGEPRNVPASRQKMLRKK